MYLIGGTLGAEPLLGSDLFGTGVYCDGAFDDALNDLLGLDGQEEAALYLVTVGQVAT